MMGAGSRLVKATPRWYGAGRAMPDPQECPMCGAMMRLKEIDAPVRVAGYPEKNTRQVREWTCPECEYFEEVDND
jgi:hypothetical protein